MSFFLIFLAIVLTGAAAFLGTRPASKTSGGAPGWDGFDEPVASLPPVLLPEDPGPSDLDRLRFAVGLRGYRMDQVDQVLDELRDQLAAKDRQIAELGEELGRLRHAAEQGQ